MTFGTLEYGTQQYGGSQFEPSGFQDVIVIARSFDVDNEPSIGNLIANLSTGISDGVEDFTTPTGIAAPFDSNGNAAISVPSNEGVNPSNTYYAIGFDTIGGKYEPQAYVVPNTGLAALITGSGAPSSGTGTDGEFYLDTVAGNVYGPKAAGAWPAGIAVVGLDTTPIGVLLLASVAPATQGAPMNTFILETAIGSPGGVMAVPTGTPQAGQVPVWDGVGEQTVWQTLTGGVPSVFGRTGAIVAEAGDYAAFYDPIGAAATARAAAEAASDPVGSAAAALASAQTYAQTVATAAKNAAEAASDPVGSAATAQSTAEAFATAAVATETTRAEAAEATKIPLPSSPANNNVLTWNGSAWIAAAPAAAGVPSVFGRTGAVTAQSGDYASFYDALGAAAAAQSAAEAASDPIGAAATAQSNAEAFATAAIAAMNWTGGDLTGTGLAPTLSATANVEQIARQQFLNQFQPPQGSVDWNGQNLVNVASLSFAPGGGFGTLASFTITDGTVADGSVVLGVNPGTVNLFNNTTDAHPALQLTTKVIATTPGVFFGGGTAGVDTWIARAAAGQLDIFGTSVTLADATIGDGSVVLGVGPGIVEIYGTVGDSWPLASLSSLSGAGVLGLGPGGTTFPDVLLERSAAATLKIATGTTNWTDGTAADGGLSAIISSGLSSFSVYHSATDTKPVASLSDLGGAGAVSLGPGGSTTPEIVLSRSAANALKITASAGVTVAGTPWTLNDGVTGHGAVSLATTGALQGVNVYNVSTDADPIVSLGSFAGFGALFFGPSTGAVDASIIRAGTAALSTNGSMTFNNAVAIAAQANPLKLSATTSGPSSLTSNTDMRMTLYKGSGGTNYYLLFAFNDGGTVRYKYMLLNGTGTTWTTGTSLPT